MTTDSTGLTRREAILAAGGAATVAAMGFGREARAAMGFGREARAAKDYMIVNGLDASTADAAFVELLKQGGVDCVHKSIGDINSVASYYGLAHTHADDITLCKSVAEIHAANKAGRVALLLGSQVATNYEAALYSDGFGVLGTFAAMRQAVTNFKGLGVAIQGLCYNTTNVFGSGCLNHDGPLTRAGHKLVESLHENKILLDVGGHCGERTSLDAIAASPGVPVVCTHTNVKALNDNPRATSDKLMTAIAKTGGVIGITAVSAFHNHNTDTQDRTEDVQATLDEHLDQYDYVKKLLGAEHVALGPDFISGWGPHLPIDPEDSAAFPPWSMAPGTQSTVEGFEDTSKMPNLIAGLQDRGWSERELDLVMGQNWLRVYEAAWGA